MRVRSFSEIVPWICLVSDGVVACKDGGLMATFEISGRDSDGLMLVERDAMLERAATVFAELAIDPWSVVFTLKNSYDLEYPEASMELEAAAVLDGEHREFVERVAAIRPRSFLSLHLGPPKTDERFFGNIGGMLAKGESLPKALVFGLQSLFFNKHAFAYRAQELALAVQKVEAAMDRLRSVLPDWGLRRVSGKELVGFLRSTVSGKVPSLVPTGNSGNWFLDTGLPDSALTVRPKYLQLGDRYVSAISIKEWPQATGPEFVEAIMASGVESTLSVSYRLMSKEDAKAAIGKIKSYAEMTQYGLKDYVKAMFASQSEPDAGRADRSKRFVINDADLALDAMTDGVAFGHMNVSLAVYADDLQELEDATEYLYKRISPLYPGAVRESLHLLSCWAGTMPGQLQEQVRWALMHTGNLADCAPVFLPTRGSKRNLYFEEQTERPAPALTVFPVAKGGHYYFNFHRGALGHTFVVGGSRSGKSVMMNFLISQFTKYMPCRVIIFDKDQSCRINTMLHDGTYLDLAAATDEDAKGERVSLNPLALIGEQRHWDFLVQWIVDLAQGKGFKVSTAQEGRIREAIEEMYRNGRPEQWRLAYLATLLPMELRAELEPFIEGGQYGHFFDNERDSFSIGTITAFEMGEVLRNERVGPLVINYAFYRIQRLLEDNRRPGHPVIPTFIYLEECWFLFENPTFQERIRDWLKTLAKYGAFVVMATQSLEDMVSDNRKLFSSIRDNISTMIFLPNPRAATKSVAEVYKREFGLSDEVIQDVATSTVRRDYIIVNDDHIKKVSCSFSSKQLAFLRSDSLALSIFNEELAKGGGWQDRYLARVME